MNPFPALWPACVLLYIFAVFVFVFSLKETTGKKRKAAVYCRITQICTYAYFIVIDYLLAETAWAILHGRLPSLL